MADNNQASHAPAGPANPPTNNPPDPRVASARFSFGEDVAITKYGTTLLLKNYMPQGKQVQVTLFPDGRIEQRDTASHVAKISNLTIKIVVNGMPFEIDHHAISSTPNDLIYAINGIEDQVQALRALDQRLLGVDAIAMVRPQFEVKTGNASAPPNLPNTQKSSRPSGAFQVLPQHRHRRYVEGPERLAHWTYQIWV
jgi:hypothetical protein